MKLLVCLSLVLAVTRAQEQNTLFDMIGEAMRNGTEALKNIVFESVIEEDGSAYKPIMKMGFDLVEDQFCPLESVEQCQPYTSWLFGCKCRKTFAALGECGAVPCRAFHWIKSTGPEALSKFLNTDSYKEKTKVLADYLMKPLASILCGCTSVFKASTKCIKNYDGMIFEAIPDLDRARFDNLVNTLDWNAAHGILEGLFDVGCGEDMGKHCTEQIGELYTAFGVFLDNTFSGQDTCLSFIRLETEFIAYVMSLTPSENQNINEYFQKMADAYVNMKVKWMCDTKCADEIQANFYHGCCLKRGTDVFRSAGMRKKYGKLARSIAKLFGVEDVVNVKQVVKKYLSIFDFEAFCGEGVDAYRNFNEQCNAIGA